MMSNFERQIAEGTILRRVASNNDGLFSNKGIAVFTNQQIFDFLATQKGDLYEAGRAAFRARPGKDAVRSLPED